MSTKLRIPHIDGLRGVAVLFVVVYHFFPGVLRGGFIGVDVFFVISGYVIQRQLKSMKRFDFIEFYSRRVLRIFPSLIIVLFATVFLGRFFFFDYPLRLLYNSAISSSFFSTNYYFFSSTNYFDLNSISKPLLPLWSLAVEEQFYLLWPILFWIFRKQFRKVNLALILFSVSSALVLGHISQSYNFYSLQTRFWEIALGIHLNSISPNTCSRLLSRSRGPLTLLLIIIAFAGFGESTWPNLATILVVLTTAILIANPGRLLVNLLSSKYFLFLGKISFPLYLVHWPLLSFYNNMKPARIPTTDRFILILIATALAFLLYQFLEVPIQRQKGRARVWIVCILTLVLLLSGIFALTSKRALPSTSQAIRQSVTSQSAIVMQNSWYFSGGSDLPEKEIDYSCNTSIGKDIVAACEAGNEWSSVNAVVVGDSKAEIMFRALVRSKSNLQWGFIGGAFKPIIPLTGKLSINSNAEVSNFISSYLAKQSDIKVVLIVSATRNLFKLSNDFSLNEMNGDFDVRIIQDGFAQWISPLSQHKKRILIFRDNPTLHDPTYCHGIFPAVSMLDRFVQKAQQIEGCYYDLNKFKSDSSKYQSLLTYVKGIYPSVEIVDLTDYFCDESSGRCEIFRNGRLLYSYTDHISDFAADFVARQVVQNLERSTL